MLGFRDGLTQTLQVIQKSQFLNTWHKLIYDRFDSIRDSSRSSTYKRQRSLALELPFDKEFQAVKVSHLSIRLAQLYANVSEKTVQRDIEKLVALELVRKSENGYITNTNVLRSMVAKRRHVPNKDDYLD